MSANSLPKLRDRHTSSIAGLRSRSSSKRLALASLLPSSTQDHLVALVEAGEDPLQALEERADIIGLVVHRHDDGEHQVLPGGAGCSHVQHGAWVTRT